MGSDPFLLGKRLPFAQQSIPYIGCILCWFGGISLPLPAYAEVSPSTQTHRTSAFQRFVDESTFLLSGRYRYQFTDQDDLPKNANASTLRTRVGLETGELYHFRFRLEGQDVSRVGGEQYNDGFNDKSEYPLILDPSDTEVYQGWAEFSGLPRMRLRGGRFALELDNGRFIGEEDWRQFAQNFDGVTLTNESQHHVRILYGWLGNVNRVFEQEPPRRSVSSDIHLFNIHYYGMVEMQWTGYAYWIDVNDREELSSATFGVRAHDAYKLQGPWGLFTDNEISHQQDYRENPNSYDALYWRLSGGVRYGDFRFFGGYESLGSDEGEIAFSTPLANRHNWNGFADKFIQTPPLGLQDTYAGIMFTPSESAEWLDKVEFYLSFHDFSSEEGSRDYGREWNVKARYRFSDLISIDAKYANYQADAFDSDTQLFAISLVVEFAGYDTSTRPIYRKGRSRGKPIYPLGLELDHRGSDYIY